MRDDVDMVEGEGVGRLVRRKWPVAEKRRIVYLTLAPPASAALVARSNGLNANQLLRWRRAFERGELSEASPTATALLAVTVSVPDEMVVEEATQRRRRPRHLTPENCQLTPEKKGFSEANERQIHGLFRRPGT